ncbi:unnamed protein product [Euphydryas editha]|uniref:Uncharacterized protein n=1 Tax=Euphydryas editha TaxID=104508 RepID=A0AAU9UWL1_EUPED|nr:unnamed protein product [Euphydryas editha]
MPDFRRHICLSLLFGEIFCPEYTRQTEIKTIMSERNEETSKSLYPIAPMLISPRLQLTPIKPHATQFSGYDKQAHQTILNEFIILSSANGCAIPTENQSANSNYRISNILITLLVNILNNKDSVVTDHVAKSFFSILQQYNRSTQVSSVACQEHPE